MRTQALYDALVGSGATIKHDWYGCVHITPSAWTVSLIDDEGERHAITDRRIGATVRAIATGHHDVHARLVQECKNLLRQPESADMDSDFADVVMQIAAFGKVIFT